MKNKILSIVLVMMMIASLFILTGCGNEKSSKKSNENGTEERNSYDEKNEVNKTSDNNITDNNSNNNSTVAKEVDKTPVDIKSDSSYYFVINGKKYSAGDKISTLSESGFHLNKTGSEIEIQSNGYIIGGGAVLNNENNTVFQITPFNNTKEKIKGADASIGSFYIDESSVKKYNLNVEIVNGITIGTSMQDIEAIFGEPTKKTEATQYNGPTYTYDVSGQYKSFTFNFDKDGKITSMRWQAYVLAK